jgi:hypothetical protein
MFYRSRSCRPRRGDRHAPASARNSRRQAGAFGSQRIPAPLTPVPVALPLKPPDRGPLRDLSLSCRRSWHEGPAPAHGLAMPPSA